MSKQECLVADWYMIGLEDGTAGRSMQTLASHRKACAKAEITPNLAEYERGHQRGARSYCVIENGFRLGASGGSPNGICAGELAPSFLNGYEEGRKRFKASQQVSKVEKEIKDIQDELVVTEDDIKFHEEALIAGEGTVLERAEHLKAIKELSEAKEHLEIDLEHLYRDLESNQNQLQALVRRQERLGFN